MIQFTNHAFKGLDNALRDLFSLLQSMGGHIEEILALMPAALEGADNFGSAKAIDKSINEAEALAERVVTDILGKYTPSGEELRFVIGSIKVSGNLERAADKAKNSLKHLAKLAQPLPAPVKTQLGASIAAVRPMIPLCVAQVVDYKPETTTELLKHGAAVQAAYRQITIALQATPANADATHLLLIAKNLEQISDLAVEIMKTAHAIHFKTKYEKAGA